MPVVLALLALAILALLIEPVLALLNAASIDATMVTGAVILVAGALLVGIASFFDQSSS